MSRLRPTEVKAVAEMLSQPAADEYELAENSMRKINDMRSKRKDYVVFMLDSGIPSVWGTFETINAAKKAVGKTVVASKTGAQGYIVPLISGDE